jgi:hypothetical protein
MTRPWHRRRLRGARTVRRTSSAARMRAHLLALAAWESTSAAAAYWRAAEPSPWARRWARNAEAAAEGWAAAARRWPWWLGAGAMAPREG